MLVPLVHRLSRFAVSTIILPRSASPSHGCRSRQGRTRTTIGLAGPSSRESNHLLRTEHDIANRPALDHLADKKQLSRESWWVWLCDFSCIVWIHFVIYILALRYVHGFDRSRRLECSSQGCTIKVCIQDNVLGCVPELLRVGSRATTVPIDPRITICLCQ